ncbi:MAG: PEGA domain-containing protein [Myxococcota bacterium]|nr:PEGA domain-containing protein [Myxococcota bacterium]
MPNRQELVLRYLSLCALMTSLPGLALAQQVEQSSIAVMGLESSLDDKAQAQRATRLIIETLQRRGDLEVLELSDVTMGELLLVEGCEEPSSECLANAVWREQASQVLFGSIDALGDEVSVVLKVYIEATGELKAVYSRRFRADSLDAVLVEDLESLLQTRDWTLPAYLDLAAVAHGAEVFVDGERMGASPLFTAELGPGRHLLRIEAAGYEPWEQWVELSRGRLLRLSPSLVKRVVSEPELVQENETTWEAPAVTWVLFGVSGLCLSSAALSGLMAMQTKSDFDAELRERQAYDLQARAENWALASNVLVGIGGATLLAALVSLAWGEEVPSFGEVGLVLGSWH